MLRRLAQTLAVGMSSFRSALENGPGEAVGSPRSATGAGAASGCGAPSLAPRRRVLASSPAGLVFAAFTRKRRSRVQLCGNRGRGRASLSARGGRKEVGSSTANKSLKYVPALRASTGRS